MKKNIEQKNKKGFSILEITISMFIFSLVAIVAVSAFASSFFARKTVRKEQRNLEEARTAMETMAKNIRMSNYLNSVDAKTITMFNSSQGVCLKYYFTGANGKLMTARANLPAVNDPIDCSNGVITYPAGSVTEIISIPVDGMLSIIETNTAAGSEAIGKATILINIGSGNESQNIQTTVSFRDYKGVLP